MYSIRHSFPQPRSLHDVSTSGGAADIGDLKMWLQLSTFLGSEFIGYICCRLLSVSGCISGWQWYPSSTMGALGTWLCVCWMVSLSTLSTSSYVAMLRCRMYSRYSSSRNVRMFRSFCDTSPYGLKERKWLEHKDLFHSVIWG